MKRYLFLCLTLIWMGVIFMFSGQQGDESASLSSSLTFFFLKLVYPKITALDMQAQMQIFDIFQFLIRKAAHMSEYAVLWLLSFQFLKTYHFSGRRCFLWALVFCFVYACTDEFHQSLIPGRGPAFSDVLIDSSGACLFGTIFCIWENKFKKRREHLQ